MLHGENFDRHRDELQRAALEELRALDGSTKSAVQMLTGASDDELDDLGDFGR